MRITTNLEAKSVRIQNRISPIIKAMTFPGRSGIRSCYGAIQYFKDKDGAIDKTVHRRNSLKPVEEGGAG